MDLQRKILNKISKPIWPIPQSEFQGGIPIKIIQKGLLLKLEARCVQFLFYFPSIYDMHCFIAGIANQQKPMSSGIE